MNPTIRMQPQKQWFHINLNEVLIKLLSTILFPLLIAIDGHFAFLLFTEQLDPDTFEAVQGPFGALVILLLLTGILGRFIFKLMERNDKLRDKIEQMYKDRINDLEKKA